MSKRLEPKLRFMLEKIDDLLSYTERYSSIEALLNDRMGFDATLMSLLQIGETLNKLRNAPFSDELPIQGLTTSAILSLMTTRESTS